MSLMSPHEALIYLMVITSAADREMTDVELARIGNVLKTWPVFQDFDDWKLIRVAQDCQQRLQQEGGLESIFAHARPTFPKKLHDTAYAALRRCRYGRRDRTGDQGAVPHADLTRGQKKLTGK